MKKFASILAALLMALVLAAAGCAANAGGGNNGGGSNTGGGKAAIILKSDENQSLKVGDSMQIVSTIRPASAVCEYESTDENIVTVDRYGSVKGVGVGKANVILTLAEHPDVTATVKFTVTRNFFMTQSGYKNGTLDMTMQEYGGNVYIKSGQAQMLVNDAGEEWYFSCHLDHTGVTNGDNSGGWGVGSFLVNDAYSIGDVMYWYALRSHNGSTTQAKLYYGGWRYDSSVSLSKETPVSDDTVIDFSNGVDVSIYRKGTTHYFSIEWGDTDDRHVLKHHYEVPLFAGKSTFPGVFGQNQVVTVSKYDSSSDVTTVTQKLSTFQKAEHVSVKVTDTRLFAGETYKFVSTVTPDYTIDKSVTYSLKSPVDEVDITEEGLLTVSSTATGEVTLVATANSGENVSKEYVFNITNKAASTSDWYDSGALVGTFTPATGGGKVSSGNSYIPLVAEKNGDWYLTATVKNELNDDGNTSIGLMGASTGFTDNFFVSVDYNNDGECPVSLGLDSGAQYEIKAAGNGLKQTTELGLLKKGGTFYVFVGGKLVKVCEASVYNCVPALFSEGAKAAFTEVTLITDENEIQKVLDSNQFIVGSYVTQNITAEHSVYNIAHKDFGSADDMNWPPVNDYANGLKFTEALSGDYTIEFGLSGVTKYNNANKENDGKILIYLRSERTTCSLQFEIKDYKQADGSTKTQAKFVCNLDDATWATHDLPEDLDLLSGSHTVKVVKTATKVQLFIDGDELFAGEAFMNNTGYWNENTVSTPGIGTFLCNATITDPTITKN